MKIERLRQLQPKLFFDFQQILQSGKLAHSYLFSGGFASLEMALMLAQALFCELTREGLPCQQCRSCQLIESGDFTDVKRLSPTNNIIKTDLVRGLLQEFSQSGFESDKQVFIIDGADKLHPNAANSLLKFIEEPQSQIYIFLLSQQDTTVLPTIRSRCQVYHFPKNTDLMMVELEQSGLLKSQARLMTNLAPDLTRALELSASQHFMEIVSIAQTWVKQFLAEDQLAYLTCAKLAHIAEDKAEQGDILNLITLLLADNVDSPRARKGLDQVLEAQQMWRANVNFQSLLEYMILT